MFIKCIVSECKNNNNKNTKFYKKDVTFHKFPELEVLKELWIKLCGLPKKTNVNNRYVCSEHFSPDLFKKDFRGKLTDVKGKGKILIPNAVPNRNIPAENEIEETTSKRKVIYLPEDDENKNEGEKSETENYIVVIEENTDDDNIESNTEEIVNEKDKAIKDLRGKLDLLSMEYQILKSINLEHQVKINSLQKDNAFLKKLYFERKK